MTREQYLEMRKNNSINLDLFFSYYKDKGGKYDYNTFVHYFPMYFHTEQNKIMQDLDSIFSIIFLTDKENKLVTIL
jgi:hypothetical protein